MNAQSRRAFLTAGTAALAGAGLVTSTLVKAADQEPVQVLWAQWLDAVTERTRLRRLHDEAQARMPGWAQPGACGFRSKPATDSEMISAIIPI